MQCSLSRQRGIQQTLEAAAAKTVVTLSEERKESRSIPPLRNQKKIILGMVRLVAKMASLMYRCMQASGMKDGSRARDHQSCESLAASSSQCATISNEKPQNEKKRVVALLFNRQHRLSRCCSVRLIDTAEATKRIITRASSPSFLEIRRQLHQ